MTLVQIIDNVVGWLEREVCSQITLKLPDDFKNDATYGVEFVHPAAFPLYVPGKDRLPPSVPAPIPSVCVQLMEGSDDLLAKRRQLQIRLCLACWNPGEHGLEKLIPRQNPAAVAGFHVCGEVAHLTHEQHVGLHESEDLPLFECGQSVVVHDDGDLFPLYHVKLGELVHVQEHGVEVMRHHVLEGAHG